MKISVIIAARLQPRPEARPESLWLDRALRSVRRQTAHVWSWGSLSDSTRAASCRHAGLVWWPPTPSGPVPIGVVGTAHAQEEARLRHEGDVRRMTERYGGVPW